MFTFRNPGFTSLLTPAGPPAPVYSPEYTAVQQAILETGATLVTGQDEGADRLVRDLLGEFNPAYVTLNLWPKLRAVYGYLGGTAEAHKFNWKNPVDADAAFRLTYAETPVHSSTGMLTNGVDQYARTSFNPADEFLDGGLGFGTYLRLDTPNYGAYCTDMGAVSNGAYASIAARYGAATYFGANTPETYANGGADSRGFWVSSNYGGVGRLFKNAAQLATATPFTVPIDSEVLIGAMRYNKVPGYMSRNEHVFSFIAEPLSPAEVAALTAAVQAYQVSQNRAVYY